MAPGRGPQEKPKVVILNAVKNLFFVDSRSLIESSFGYASFGFAQDRQDRRFAQTVLAPKMECAGPGHSHARRRRDNYKEQRLWILAYARMTEKSAGIVNVH